LALSIQRFALPIRMRSRPSHMTDLGPICNQRVGPDAQDVWRIR
jgi:hypothetical protein